MDFLGLKKKISLLRLLPARKGTHGVVLFNRLNKAGLVVVNQILSYIMVPVKIAISHFSKQSRHLGSGDRLLSYQTSREIHYDRLVLTWFCDRLIFHFNENHSRQANTQTSYSKTTVIYKLTVIAMGVFSICVNIAENFKCWFTYTIAIHNLFFVVPTHTPNKPLTKINSTWPPVDNTSVKTNREFSEDLPFCLLKPYAFFCQRISV